MKKINYNYNPALAFAKITEDWLKWAEETKARKFIIGLSGGKDSSVVAALATKIFGAENVIGVFMPNGKINNEDMTIINSLITDLKIKNFIMNINDANKDLLSELERQYVYVLEDTKVNLPARIRMTMLYAIAQSFGARVICTGNLSENMIGYSTIYGDHAGAYAPIADLTVQEVIQLGEWLGLDKKYTRKIPTDGLCGQTDEDKLGFTYRELDNYIRLNIGMESKEKMNRVEELYKKNKFKLDTVQIPYPQMPWYNYLISNIEGLKE